MLLACMEVLGFTLLWNKEGIVLVYDNFRVLDLLALGVCSHTLFLLLELLKDLNGGLLYLSGSSSLCLLIVLLFLGEELFSSTVHWHDWRACAMIFLLKKLFS